MSQEGVIMDLQKGIPADKETSQEELVRSLNTCCLCGSSLEFTHVKNKETFVVQEAAKCPSCGIQTKVNTFILQ